MKLLSRFFLSFFIPFLALSAVAKAEQQPVPIELTDLNLGTEGYNSLVEYSNGGHADLGQALANAGVTENAPGIGFGVGSGGLGYRPNITVWVWTDESFSKEQAIQAILALVNVPSAPVVTGGDCEISCDGTGQNPDPISLVTSHPTSIIQSEPILQPVVSAPIIEPNVLASGSTLVDSTIPFYTTEIKPVINNKKNVNKKIVGKNKNKKLSVKNKNLVRSKNGTPRSKAKAAGR